MSNKPNEVRFEEFRFSFLERCLFRGNKLVSLSNKECEILVALLGAAGQVVQKEDLCKRIWPDKEVEASNLFHQVKSLRSKLGPREDGQSFIETIPGRGYRLLIPEDRNDLEQRIEINPDDSSSPPEGRSDRAQVFPQISLPPKPLSAWHTWRWIAALALIALIVAGASVLLSRRLASAGTPSAVAILTSPESVHDPRLLKLIEVGPQPSSALLIKKRHELYVSDAGNAVSVIDTNRDVVVDRIPVGIQPTKLAVTSDGKRIFIAQAGGGIGMMEIASHSFRYASEWHETVQDIVLSPDGKSAYLAAGFRGVAKLDLLTEKITIISKIVFARALALTSDGRRLYVSYQAKGPGGSFGHDAIGFFDATNDRFTGALSGFPNVGECLTVSPDNSQVWENGADACDSPQYDHIGCPFVPGGLLNVISTSSNKIRGVGVRGARLLCSTFSPDGEFAAVGTTDHLMLIRARDLVIMGSLPIGSSGRIAFAEDGSKAYVPINAKSQVAVIEIGVQVRTLNLANLETEGQTVQLAIQSDPSFDAKSIDPTSLRLGGVPAERGRDGSLVASIERVAGFEGHSLIVKFNLEGTKRGQELLLVGKTYAGIPIYGTVDSFHE